MKIARIETIRVSIPFGNDGPRVGLRPSLDSKPWVHMECLMARVETDDGLVGWGEAFGHFVNAGTQEILNTLVGPWFIGKDPRPITTLMDEAQRGFHGFGRSGPVIYALSAIDIALWDLAAKRAGQPLYRLLGGRDGTLDLYASLTRYRGDPEALRRNCQRAQKIGYRMIKLHEVTIDAFMVAREALANALQHARPGRVTLRLEGGPRWLRLQVQDDGRGPAPSAAAARPGHLGMVGMRERSIAIGARFEVGAAPGGGTLVALHWEDPR